MLNASGHQKERLKKEKNEREKMRRSLKQKQQQYLFF